MPPRVMADTLDRLPPKLPIGVRTAERIYTSFMLRGLNFVNAK
jgi:hypothetical protein